MTDPLQEAIAQRDEWQAQANQLRKVVFALTHERDALRADIQSLRTENVRLGERVFALHAEINTLTEPINMEGFSKDDLDDFAARASQQK